MAEAARAAARAVRVGPAGVRVRHNLGTETPSAEAVAAPGRAQVVADFRAVRAPEKPESVGAGDAVLPLRVEVLLRLTQQNLSAAEREAIADKVRAAVTDYVGSVPMGAMLVYNKLLGRIVQPDEIADAALLLRARDAPADGASYRTNLDSGGRKVTVALADIAVELMEQAVKISIRVRLQPHLAAAASRAAQPEAAAPPQVTDALRTSIRTAIEGVLAAASGTIRRDDVRSAVVTALGGPTADLILTERDGLVLNATYEETGRLLNNADSVALAEHEVALLADLAVDMASTLDA